MYSSYWIGPEAKSRILTPLFGIKVLIFFLQLDIYSLETNLKSSNNSASIELDLLFFSNLFYCKNHIYSFYEYYKLRLIIDAKHITSY